MLAMLRPSASFVAAVAAKFGSVDICVTNAGGPPAKSFLAATLEEWHRALDLNFLSTVYFAREVIPHMQRKRWGRIVTHHFDHDQTAGH